MQSWCRFRALRPTLSHVSPPQPHDHRCSGGGARERDERGATSGGGPESGRGRGGWGEAGQLRESRCVITICLASRLRDGAPVAGRSVAHQSPLHQLARFVGVGGFATVAQLSLFALLSLVVSQGSANVIAWTVSTLVANAAQRTFAFDVHGQGAWRDLSVGMAFSLLGLAVSAVALTIFDTDEVVAAVAILIAVNLVVGGVRFLALRRWYVARLS